MRISWGDGRKAIGSDGSIPKGYKPWLIVSLVVLVGSLMLLAGDLMAAFYYFADAARPVWVAVMGALAALGIALGFGGFFLMMVVAGLAAWREGRRVQVIPPVHAAGEEQG